MQLIVEFQMHMQLELECPIRTCVKLAATLCVMWFARRNAIHGNIFQSPLSTHLFVERFLAELDEIKSLPNNSWQQSTAARAMRQPLQSAWKSPLDWHMKNNVDGALSCNGSVRTAVAVCRCRFLRTYI